MKAFQGLGRSLILLNIVLFIQTISGQIGSVQRCGDAQCQGPISEGRTVLKYHANSNSMLSFTTNQPVLIFSKGEGSQSDIWGVEINGKRGFVNRRHIRETRVGVRNLGYVAPPHHTYYEMQLGGPDAAAHMQRQQQMQGQEGPEVAAQQHHHHQHHHHNHQHQERGRQPHVLPNVPHPSAQQQPPPTQRHLLSDDPNISQPQNDLKQPASEPKVENVEPALFQPEANLQQQQPNMVDSTGASQEGSSSMTSTSSEAVTGTGNDVTKPALPASPEDPASDQNIAMEPKISESDTHLAENEETAQKLLDEPEVTSQQPPSVILAHEKNDENKNKIIPEAAAEQEDELNKNEPLTKDDEQPIEDSPEQPLDEVKPENDPGNEFVFYEPELTEEEKMQLPLEKEFVTEPEVNNQLTGSLQEQQINQDYQNYDAESSQEFQHVQDQAQNDPEVQNDVHGHVEFNQDDTNKEELGVLYETSLHYLESLKYFVPEWIHKSLHWNSVDGINPTAVIFGVLGAISIVLVTFLRLVFDKCSNENTLKARAAELDKKAFKAENELLIIKRDCKCKPTRQLDNLLGKLPPQEPVIREVTKEVIKEIPPKAMLVEVENLKREKQLIWDEREKYRYEYEQVNLYQTQLQEQNNTLIQELGQVKDELSEAESVVQECVEEKKKFSSVNNTELVKAVDTLRDQLNLQKESLQKYEGKIKRREAEIKEKTQELRKLRAETANAKLQVDKVVSERDGLKSKIEALEAMELELTDQNSGLQVQISVMDSVKQNLNVTKEKLDEKEAELESANTEVAVLEETINALKSGLAIKSDNCAKSDNGFEDDNGWDVEDDVELDASEATNDFDLEAITNHSRLKVDLQKAQAACETLTEQLTNAETAKEKFEAEAKKFREEAEIARKTKEAVLEEKNDMTKKHEVLTSYFNQREAELQKQLGVQTQRLDEVEVDSESVSKKLNTLYDELESYKSQCKSLKQEMDDQERSLKSQNATLEKKQHDSWVTVRQESRKLTEAQNEMQTLRARLTVAETKLAEKTVEIDNLMQENQTMKETMDRINNHQILKPDNTMNFNGTNSMPSSGPGSLHDRDELPPELPPLPEVPAFPIHHPMMPPVAPMQMHPQTHMMYNTADTRPAPLGGRLSPPHGGRAGGRYPNRSPSPPPYSNGASGRYRNVSPSPSERSERSSYSYDEGRYSPPPYPPRHRNRHSRDDRSPDRYSSRSERSDYERDYRDTPPRDHHRRRSSRDMEYPGSGQEYDYRRDKRSDRVKDRHGPKTSSPMT